MNVYAIRNDKDPSKDLAYLLYYKKSKQFYIEMLENIDSKELPIILKHFYDEGKRGVNSYWSYIWVKERIVPQDRQNIAMIIKCNGLTNYDELQLLILGNGRCSQDDFFIEKVIDDSLPVEISIRFSRQIDDCICLNNKDLLVFFRNGVIKKVDLKSLVHVNPKISILLDKEILLSALEILPGGYELSFGNGIRIDNEDLYNHGIDVNIVLQDLIKYISERIVNTSEASEILNCSRQNINDLVKRKKLNPIKTTSKNQLFLKTDIEKRQW